MIIKKIAITFLLIATISCYAQKSKKQKVEPTTILALALASACNPSLGKFYYYDINIGDYSCLSASNKYSRSGVDIYVESGLEDVQANYGLTKLNYKNIADKFVDQIQKTEETIIGKPTDINKDGKITILFFGTNNNPTGGSFIGGYVDPVNFFVTGELPSNQREMLYINGLELVALNVERAAKNRPDVILSTIAHEYQHLVRFQYEMKKPGLSAPIPIPTTNAELNSLWDYDDSWINEGTSELMTDLAGYGPQYERASCFRGDPSYSCPDGFNGASLFTWNGNILNYSIAYLYMKFLYDVSGTTTADRQSFLTKTITGSTLRGHDPTQLMQLFQATPIYITSLSTTNASLSTDPSGIFSRLYAIFLSKALGYEFNSTSANDTTFQIGNATPIPMYTFSTTYQFSTELANLLSFPNQIVKNNGTNFELFASQVFRIGNARATGTYDSNSIYVKRGTNGGTDPIDGIIFNGNLDKTNFITTKDNSSGKGNSLSQNYQEGHELNMKRKLQFTLGEIVNKKEGMK